MANPSNELKEIINSSQKRQISSSYAQVSIPRDDVIINEAESNEEKDESPFQVSPFDHSIAIPKPEN